MVKPVVSKNFNLEDIRKIREYNSLRHAQMTPEEIIEDICKGAAMVLERIRNTQIKAAILFLPFLHIFHGDIIRVIYPATIRKENFASFFPL